MLVVVVNSLPENNSDRNRYCMIVLPDSAEQDQIIAFSNIFFLKNKWTRNLNWRIQKLLYLFRGCFWLLFAIMFSNAWYKKYCSLYRWKIAVIPLLNQREIKKIRGNFFLKICEIGYSRLIQQPTYWTTPAGQFPDFC